MGAVGLMQIIPATGVVVARNLGLKLKVTERVLQDPFVNLTLGVAYLAWLRDHYHGLSPYYLEAAYNVGPAKLDELRSRKSFKPVNTKKYYEAIRRGVPGFRFYRGKPAKTRRRAKPVTDRVIEARRS
jgi:soluble lytic murein transglycosylase-like protein